MLKHIFTELDLPAGGDGQSDLVIGDSRRERQPSRRSASASHPRRNVSDGTLDR